MSLRQKVRLELDDGGDAIQVIEVEYSAIDLRAWERENRKSALNEAMSVGMLTWLGWSAARRQGSINGSYDTFTKFDAACVDVAGVRDEEPEADPTKPARSGGTRKVRGAASSAP